MDDLSQKATGHNYSVMYIYRIYTCLAICRLASSGHLANWIKPHKWDPGILPLLDDLVDLVLRWYGGNPHI